MNAFHTTNKQVLTTKERSHGFKRGQVAIAKKSLPATPWLVQSDIAAPPLPAVGRRVFEGRQEEKEWSPASGGATGGIPGTGTSGQFHGQPDHIRK
jgi:hypothetical protein